MYDVVAFADTDDWDGAVRAGSSSQRGHGRQARDQPNG